MRRTMSQYLSEDDMLKDLVDRCENLESKNDELYTLLYKIKGAIMIDVTSLRSCEMVYELLKEHID